MAHRTSGEGVGDGECGPSPTLPTASVGWPGRRFDLAGLDGGSYWPIPSSSSHFAMGQVLA